ncbi:MAG: hypothetical protein KatS3mg005_0816 [Bryobacteraceae bacterium]|nr:MAG: hypothetical protein KatS3mg005_0816 [Bryobacteraceae bacterium]
MNRFVWMLAAALGLLPGGRLALPAADGPAAAAAGGGPERAMVLPYGGVFTHVAVGGPWRTLVTVVNTHVEKPAECELRFRSQKGEPLTVKLDGGTEARTGSVFPVSLPPLGSIRLITLTEDPEVRMGWATLERREGRDCFVAAYATFRAVVPGQPDYEALVPSEPARPRAVVPFDNRNGFGTAVAVVNPYASEPLELDVEIYGEDGKLVQKYRERLDPGGHAAFQTAERWPATAERAGLIRIRRVGNWDFTALGLLFNPSRSVTTVPVVSIR